MVTVALAILLGLPFALYLHRRRGVKLAGALAFGGLLVMCLLVALGAVLEFSALP